MDCESILKKICDELSEDIHSELCASIRQHLKECATCEQNLSAMRRTVELFRCLNQEAVPPNIHQRLVRLLNIELVSNEKR